MPAEVPGAGAGARILTRAPTPGVSEAQRPLARGRELADLHAASPAPPLAPAPKGSGADPRTAREVVPASRTALTAASVRVRLDFFPHFPFLSTIKGRRDSWIFKNFCLLL